MARILFKNCLVWDGSGAASYPADVMIDGDRIQTVATGRGQLDEAGAEVIDAHGMTLMPGLVEGHSHITFLNVTRATDLGDTPPEEHTLLAARNARLLLDHGFTSAYSTASAKLRIDVVIRNAIEAGECPDLGVKRLHINGRGRVGCRTGGAKKPRATRCALQAVIWFGCISYCWANSASVFSPLRAASATLALKAEAWVRRVRFVMHAS
jgi:imidazolonepropionase-like amidohydrolase